MKDLLYFIEWHLSDGSPYLHGCNSKRSAFMHAKKDSMDARFGGSVRVLSRMIGTSTWNTVATFTNGIKQ